MKLGILAILTIIIASIAAIGVKNTPVVAPTNTEVSNIKSFYFTYSNGYAMNAYTRYEINKKEGKFIAKIKQHGEPEEDAKEVEISEVEINKLEAILNKYKVGSWNGFNKTNKNVLDGDSFSFSVHMENDDSISASGYMSWPENYRNVVAEIDNYFEELIK